MQILGATTRKQVELQHRAEIWMDNGVLSYRNVRRLPNWQQYAWYGPDGC